LIAKTDAFGVSSIIGKPVYDSFSGVTEIYRSCNPVIFSSSFAVPTDNITWHKLFLVQAALRVIIEDNSTMHMHAGCFGLSDLSAISFCQTERAFALLSTCKEKD